MTGYLILVKRYVQNSNSSPFSQKDHRGNLNDRPKVVIEGTDKPVLRLTFFISY